MSPTQEGCHPKDSTDSQCNEGTGAQLSNAPLNKPLSRGADKNSVIQYLGIAADEPIRIERHTKPGIELPLVLIGWEEAYCRKWCEENDLLSPIYTTATRGGCWFCHNQGVGQLRILRHDYPELWVLLMKWDMDSPVSFHPDGHTVHDFNRRFEMEDRGFIDPNSKNFKWKFLDDEFYDMQYGIDDTEQDRRKLRELLADYKEECSIQEK